MPKWWTSQAAAETGRHQRLLHNDGMDMIAVTFHLVLMWCWKAKMCLQSMHGKYTYDETDIFCYQSVRSGSRQGKFRHSPGKLSQCSSMTKELHICKLLPHQFLGTCGEESYYRKEQFVLLPCLRPGGYSKAAGKGCGLDSIPEGLWL